MQRVRVNDHDLSYIDLGQGPPLVCVHGSLSDFRVWSPVLGLLSRRHRVVAISLRRCFPEHWDGAGGGFSIAQHIADVIAFIEILGAGPVHLLGHSRGGHIAFRVAQQRPDLLRKLVLAEPGGELDASLAPSGMPPSALGPPLADAAKMIAAGDIDGGLAVFVDAVDGAGAWGRRPEAAKQELRDNARTLIGQVADKRPPYTRADAAGIRVPTLLVGGTDTPGALPVVLQALAAHIPAARVAMIPNATHVMFVQDPVRFCAAVAEFLGPGEA